MFPKNQFRQAAALAIVLAALLAAGCAAQPDAAATLTAALTPYHTVTATSRPPSATPPPPGAPTTAPPTPTPFIYTVRSGDTMSVIALNFGITVEELQAANPTVDPRFLSVGANLTIPTEGQDPAASLPSPTPVALTLGTPHCLPTADEGLWCFVMAANPAAQGVENVEARLTLVDGEGNAVGSGLAILPLNLLPAGGGLPLAVFFPPPAPGYAGVGAELLAALPVTDGSGRYLAPLLGELDVRIAEGGLAAELTGLVSLPEGSLAAGRVWVAAVALDREGQVVGLRRWESDAPLAGGGSVAFSFNVYSLGGAIGEVLLLAEARP